MLFDAFIRLWIFENKKQKTKKKSTEITNNKNTTTKHLTISRLATLCSDQRDLVYIYKTFHNTQNTNTNTNTDVTFDFMKRDKTV